MYRRNVARLVELGRRTLIIDAPHGVADETATAGANGLPMAQARRVTALRAAVDDKQLHEIDAIGHSEGCLDVIYGAHVAPMLFRNLVLVDAPGLLGHDTAWRLAGRFLADAICSFFDSIRQPTLKRPLGRAAREIGGSFMRSPRLALREIPSIAGSQIQTVLRQLGTAGIRVSMVHAVNDGTFPMEQVQRRVKQDMVDGFLSVKGRHDQFQLEPVEYSKLAEYALRMMDAKRAKAENPHPSLSHD